MFKLNQSKLTKGIESFVAVLIPYAQSTVPFLIMHSPYILKTLPTSICHNFFDTPVIGKNNNPHMDSVISIETPQNVEKSIRL